MKLANVMLKARARVGCMFVPLCNGPDMPNVSAISSYIAQVTYVSKRVYVYLCKRNPGMYYSTTWIETLFRTNVGT